MNDGTDKLRSQLDNLAKALQVFSDPVVNELPGLRLMRETLAERERHAREQIAQAETAALTVTVSGEVIRDGVLPADLAAGPLDGLAVAVSAAGTSTVAALPVPPPPEQAAAALRLHLVDVSGDADGAHLLLQRPPGELSAQLTDPGDGGLVLERAVDTVVAVLAAAEDGESLDGALADVGPDLARALRRLADLVAGAAVVAAFDWQPYAGGGRSTAFTRLAAQRLQAAIAER